jgi:multidrug efflux pump subunit AcrA (membrane-fusion protein)
MDHSGGELTRETNTFVTQPTTAAREKQLQLRMVSVRPKNARRRLPGPLLVLGVVALTLLAFAFLRPEQVREVEAAQVREGPLVLTWNATGYVEARTARISAPQVGQITEVRVREGDAVTAGGLLARLSAEETAAVEGMHAAAALAARADTEAARAALAEEARLIEDRIRQSRASDRCSKPP